MEYFYEKDLAKLKGWLVLLDYEGTLVVPGGQTMSEETKKALLQLANENKVVVCSNGPIVDGFEQLYGVSWAHLSKPKPDPESLESIISAHEGKTVVIGDRWQTDGVLARRLNVPFVHVATLGHPKKEGQAHTDLLQPAILLSDTQEAIALVTHEPLSFLTHIVRDAHNRKALREVEHLAVALEEMGVRVEIDPPALHGFQTILVWGSEAPTLQYALHAKRKGFIKFLLVALQAGTHNPKERALLQDGDIDRLLFTNETIKADFVALDQYFMRGETWNAGVSSAHSRRVRASSRQECEVVVLKTEEREFKEVIDILWRFGVSLSLPPTWLAFKKIRGYIQQRRKVSWQLIVGRGEYLSVAEKAWISDLPTLVIAPEAKVAAIPEQCGMRIDSVEQLESALPDFLESIEGYEPAQYAQIHCSTQSRARELMSLIRALSTT